MMKEDKTVIIYFSKDRPMQIDLCLRTSLLLSKGVDKSERIVLYKASDDRFKKAYLQLENLYQNVRFVKENNFKEDLLNIVDKNDYVMFVVDDTVFTESYSVKDITDALEIEPQSLGFSLRLGRNTRYCYPAREENIIPYIGEIPNNYRIGIFNWLRTKSGDFSYPLEVSSSVYKVEKIINLLKAVAYNTPNSLEWVLSINVRWLAKYPLLLCYKQSVAFSNPINKIQKENNNRVGNNPEYSIENLLEKWEQGYRISPDKFYKFVSTGCHQEVDLEFEIGK